MTSITETRPMGYFQTLWKALKGTYVDEAEYYCNLWYIETLAYDSLLMKQKAIQDAQQGEHSMSNNDKMPIIPINLRPDTLIQIVGLPKDFTRSEATYIARILFAYAKPDAEQVKQEKDLEQNLATAFEKEVNNA